MGLAGRGDAESRVRLHHGGCRSGDACHPRVCAVGRLGSNAIVAPSGERFWMLCSYVSCPKDSGPMTKAQVGTVAMGPMRFLFLVFREEVVLIDSALYVALRGSIKALHMLFCNVAIPTLVFFVLDTCRSSSNE